MSHACYMIVLAQIGLDKSLTSLIFRSKCLFEICEDWSKKEGLPWSAHFTFKRDNFAFLLKRTEFAPVRNFAATHLSTVEDIFSNSAVFPFFSEFICTLI